MGAISLAQPLSLWLCSGVAIFAAAGVILFLLLGQYTHRSRVVGQLVPDLGLATVVAPVSGVVARGMAEEGSWVARSQRLVAISVPRATTADGDVAAGLREGIAVRRGGLDEGHRSQGELLDAEARGLEARLGSARLQFAQLAAEIATQQEQLQLAEELLNRFRALASKGFVSAIQLKEQERATLQQKAALQSLQRQAITAQQDIMEVDQALREIPAKRSLQASTRTRELAELERERLQTEATGEVLVQAPVGGLIASRLVEPGQSVQAAQPLMTLLPKGALLQAQLLVPSRAIGFIEPGDSVVLRYQAFPHQKFGHHRGRIARITRSALTSAEIGALTGNAQVKEPYYRVMVELARQDIRAYGRQEPLRPGMLLEADVLGERRKLYEWVLEPLSSLTGKL